MRDVILSDFDDSGAGFSRPDASDGGVDDHFQTTLEGESAGILMKVSREHLGHACEGTKVLGKKLISKP